MVMRKALLLVLALTWVCQTGASLHAQVYGRESLQPMGAYLDGVFPDGTPGEGGTPEPPATLSATGAFSDLVTLTPRAGLLPYEVNAPLWTDRSRKQRWIAVPHDGVADTAEEKIGFSATDSWTFPAGTVLVKQFDLPVDARDSSILRRIETRFMVAAADGSFYGVTYRWREDGRDADLLYDGESASITVTSANGTESTQRWSFPSRDDCLNCHNPGAGYALGVRTHQLNGDAIYPSTGRTDNQLRTWNHLGLFSPSLDEAAIPGYLQAVSLTDTHASLEDRVRSYLDANCSQCHRPGALSTPFDARFTTPLEEQHLIDGAVLYDLGVADARVIAPQSIERSLLHRRISAIGLHQMPPIGRHLVDDAAVDIISQWIFSLPADPGSGGENRSPVAQNDEGNTLAGEAVEIPVLSNDTDLDGDVLAINDWTEPLHGTVTWLANAFVRYTPETGFEGTDSFSYTLADGEGGISNAATVTVRVVASANSSTVTFLDRSSRLPNPSNASGVAMGVADMDQDGRDDIVHLHLGKTLKVDYQNSDESFTEHSFGSISSQRQWGLCLADADGNGYPDIVSGGYYDDLHLQWNEGGRGGFTSDAIGNPRLFLQGVNVVDINGDGLLDIFACHDVGDNAKFRNTGDRSFLYDNSLLNTRTTPTSDNSGNYGSVWTDYDNDGDLDMYLSKCRGGVSSPSDPRRINMFFRNNGDGSYSNVASPLGMAFGQQSWAADFGDVDNDGDLDCFVGHHGAASTFMRNNGDGTFTDHTLASGLEVDWLVIQTVFRDFNNDGWIDLLLVGKEHQLWLNDRDGTFTLAANPFGSHDIESCAVGDLNRDGFTDLYAGYASLYNTPATSRPDKLWLTSPNGNGFLSVTLKGSGANPSAIGARLELHGAWGTQVREVRSGESYGISHSFTQIFGLGNAVAIDQLRVRWPSGVIDEIFNPLPNQFLELREGTSTAPLLTNPGPQAHQVGDVVTVAIQASDATEDDLLFEAVNLPPGLIMNAETGVISGTLTSASAGSYSVIVRVSDAWNTVFQPFAWDVLPADTAPAVIVSTTESSVTGPFEVRARFTSPVTGLALADVEVMNGTVSALSGSGTDYTFTITPTLEGAVEVSLPAGAATDGGGRGNLASNVLPVTYALPATAPVINTFTASVESLQQGETVTLEWGIDDGGNALTSLTITPGNRSVLGQTSVSFSPEATTTYLLTATNAVGTDTAEVTVVVDLPLPTADALANLVAPGSVQQGETVTVAVDYAATDRRELWVWLQDSNDGWRTASQGNVTVEAGSGTRSFSLPIDSASRVGDGYVWAMRLLPPGWRSAADAIAEQYGLADMQAGDLPPETDLLGALTLPPAVESPGVIQLDVPYQATTRREIHVYLHDSQNAWFTIGEAATTVEPGSGTHTFSIPILSESREGDGYVWAVRLLPLGWTVADDALDADYGQATVSRNTGGTATQDILTGVEAPALVQPAEIAQVTVDYEVTQRRDLGIWLHDSTDGWRTIGHGLVKVEPGIASQTFDIGIVGNARIGPGYIWAVRLLPEGWATADDAMDAFYKDAGVEERLTELVNLAVLPQASATQSSVYGAAFTADLARDGNTDGDWRNGSVTHTELDVDAWWELDLGSVQPVDHLLLWNRTDCCGDRLVPFDVFVSEEPFASESRDALLVQEGVDRYTVTQEPNPTQRLVVNRNVRYVRVQLAGANYLSLAEVEVYAPYSGEPANGLTFEYYEGTWSQLPDFETLDPVRTGTVTQIDRSPRARDDFYAFRYRGCLAIPEDGAYTLTLLSDEGSQLLLDGSVVIEHDGLHTASEATATLTLAAGMHPLELRYFERDGEDALALFWEGPGIARQAIPESAFTVNETGETISFHHVGRRVASFDNADGDLLDLTAEYALGRSPYVAALNDVGLLLEAHDDGTRLSATFERPANHREIDYWVEVSEDLLLWTPLLTPDAVESVRYGWERVRYDHLEAAPGVSLERGFVRLRIWHHDWAHESTTPVCGWYQTTLHSGYQTHGVSLNAPPVFASMITEVDEPNGILTLAAGGLTQVLDDRPHYIEITNGRWEGHRFEITPEASTDQTLALDLEGLFNTAHGLPASGLRFAQVVIRKHLTLGDVYAPGRFTSSNDPARADQLQFFNGNGFDGYFLLESGGASYWTTIGDPHLENHNSTVIPPGEGVFVRRATSDPINVLVVGHLRDHAFIQPLRRGLNLVAPIAPIAHSPVSRAMTMEDGFLGHADPTQADQIQLWVGDVIEGGRGYRSFFLLDSGDAFRYWTGSEDEWLRNEDTTILFPANRAFFFQATEEAHHSYRVPGVEVTTARE